MAPDVTASALRQAPSPAPRAKFIKVRTLFPRTIMNHAPLLQVDGLSRFYGPLQAVKNISFAVRQGEVLGFLGPNGAGKTTTMQMLTGNLAPSQGRIPVDG